MASYPLNGNAGGSLLACHGSWLPSGKAGRLPHEPRIETTQHAFGRFTIDGFKLSCLALVCEHFPLGDVEPPTAQVQGAAREPLANDRIGCQVFKLHQYVELRELIARAEPCI